MNNGDVQIMDIISSTKSEHMYGQIADRLEKDIIAGCYPERKLPSEQALAVRYSVSRAVIREALKLLSERSLVNTVVGSGTYITKPEADDLTVILDRITATHNFGVLDIIETRLILEPNAAALAAINASPEEFDAMDQVRERLKNSDLSNKEKTDLDYEFHMMICEASHNGLLTMLTKSISSMVKNLIAINIEAGAIDKDAVRHISHARILEALRERNPISAQSIMYSHLYSSKALYEKYMETKK